jgi:hypothetical protein
VKDGRQSRRRGWHCAREEDGGDEKEVADPRVATLSQLEQLPLAQSKGLPMKNDIMQNVLNLPNAFLDGSNDINTIKLIQP